MLTRHLQEVVNRTWNFSRRLTTRQDHILNAVLGLVGEAGEVADLHKKMLYHTEKDRLEALKLELGDVAYYFVKILDLYGFPLDEILDLNKQKLMARHPEFF